jgi:MoaA/NifB/PqqE/SkfB family radical SAM enzyme
MVSVSRVRLDASTACQLRCPSCPTASGEVGRKLGTSVLSAKDFERFLVNNPSVKDIELSNWGEIFLNPELIEIMRLAFERGVKLHADNGANLNSMSPGVCEALVKFGFRSIRCSIDGASQETYAAYRVRGDFDRVIANVKEINRYKKQYRSVYPKLHWQYIVFSHNISDIPKARALAKQLNMSFGLKLDWGNLYGLSSSSPSSQTEDVAKELGYSSRGEFSQEIGRPYFQKQTCSQLWLDPQINSDGRVLGCCVNHWSDFGNAFAKPIDQVLGDETMTYARQMLMGKAAPREDIPCFSCSHFQAISETGTWMTNNDLVVQKLARRFPRLTRWFLARLGLSHWLL